MRYLTVWLPWLYVLAVMQTVVAPNVEIHQVKPDLFLISVIFVGMRKGCTAATLWGMFAGLVQDVLSGGIVGFNFLSKPLIGCAVGLLRSNLDFENPNTQTVVSLAATAVEGLILSALLNAYHPSKPVLWTLYRIILPESVYNSLLLPLLATAERFAGKWSARWRRGPARMAG